ncbi:MAG: ABC transporter permease [Candidatus Dormibacterales bacterium]
MTTLTGIVTLTRLIVRRDRIRIVVWIVSIVALVALTAASIKGLFPTQADLDQTAAATQHNAAAIAFNGPAQGLNTVGGQVAFQFGAGGMVLIALMSLLMIGRLTRGEEEAGRLELIRSLPVGSRAPTTAASIVVGGMNVAVGALTTMALLAQGLPAVGSLVFGLSFMLVGLVFAGVALVAAQVTENTRVVYGATGAVLGAAFVVRAIGDIGDGTASWFSPIGWAQKARPFADERWWPLLLPLVTTLVLIGAAGALAARRDVGGGLVAPRPGRAVASRSLGNPFGLAVRLQRGTLIGWGIAVLVGGAAYGWIGPTVESFIGQNKALAEMMAAAGHGSLIDTYFATSFRIMALVATGFAIQSTLRLQSEESSMRAEAMLATPASRWQWAASHLLVAAGGSVILLGVAGLATGLTYGVAGGGLNSVPRLAASALVYAPPMWLMIGLTVAFIGLVPRAAVVSWATLAACVVIGFLGVVLRLPGWVLDLSPYERVPQLPAAALTAMPLFVITLVAAAFFLAGLVGLRRRDFGRI